MWVCATIGDDRGDNRIGWLETLTQTPCKYHVGNVIANKQDGFILDMPKNFLQTFQTPVGCGFLLVVGKVLITDDGLKRGCNTVIFQYLGDV